MKKKLKGLFDQSKLAAKKVAGIQLTVPSLNRRRHPSTSCLNCNTSFGLDTNYCPVCGQENNHNKLSFATIVTDFFHNYLSFDSKFSNSLLPFFFKPGKLTQYFIDGKRASYVNPIRLYLIISLLFFFVFNIMSRELLMKAKGNLEQTTKAIEESTKMSFKELIKQNIDTTELQKDKEEALALFDQKNDSSLSTLANRQEDANSLFSEENIEIYLKLRTNQNLSAAMILDSLNIDSLSGFQKKVLFQAVKMDHTPPDLLISQIMKNIPVMMMLLIPLLAFLLMIFYTKRQIFYFSHLVHMLHLHCFAYIIYGIAALMILNKNYAYFSVSSIILGSAFLVSLYCFISFMRLYRDRWLKTLVKMSIVSVLYTWLLSFAILIELFVSVLTI